MEIDLISVISSYLTYSEISKIDKKWKKSREAFLTILYIISSKSLMKHLTKRKCREGTFFFGKLHLRKLINCPYIMLLSYLVLTNCYIKIIKFLRKVVLNLRGIT